MSQYHPNGRVNIITPDINNLFKLYERNPVKECTTLRNATEGLWNETDLSRAYFSKENIIIVQNAIRYGVYEKSNKQYVIGPQDCDTLKVIMRSVFLQNSSNLNNSIPKQIEELNRIVTNYCVQQIYSEAQGYMKYLGDVSTLVIPIAHPVQSNTKEKVLEFKGWF